VHLYPSSDPRRWALSRRRSASFAGGAFVRNRGLPSQAAPDQRTRALPQGACAVRPALLPQPGARLQTPHPVLIGHVSSFPPY
jgi:hypothetical protein